MNAGKACGPWANGFDLASMKFSSIASAQKAWQ